MLEMYQSASTSRPRILPDIAYHGMLQVVINHVKKVLKALKRLSSMIRATENPRDEYGTESRIP